MPPQQQQQQCDPSKAKPELQLVVDLRGAGAEGAGKQQLLQRQQLPQSPRLQEEQHSRGLLGLPRRQSATGAATIAAAAAVITTAAATPQ